MQHNRNYMHAIICCLFLACIISAGPAAAQAAFGPEELIQAGGVVIDVPGFSVPSFVHWNGDALPDLVVGEGGLGLDDGKVRVYLNTGTAGDPSFTGFFYVQSNGTDLASPSGG